MNEESLRVRDRSAVDISLLLVRIIVGVIFAAHGSQKLFGAFGGGGLAKTVEMMGGGVLPYLVTIGEFFGGLGLIFGFLSRFSAASLIVIMLGAIATVHGKNGLFLSYADPKLNGFEFCLALIGCLLPTLICGPGAISIGRLFMPKSARTDRPVVILE
jgi:putative oxidoreductase